MCFHMCCHNNDIHSDMMKSFLYFQAVLFIYYNDIHSDMMEFCRYVQAVLCSFMMIFSIRMIKMCDESLVQPSSLIFKGCIDTGVYPDT